MARAGIAEDVNPPGVRATVSHITLLKLPHFGVVGPVYPLGGGGIRVATVTGQLTMGEPSKIVLTLTEKAFPRYSGLHWRRPTSRNRGYLDEQGLRFNNRKATDGQRFVRLLKDTVGKRLTYSEPTGVT